MRRRMIAALHDAGAFRVIPLLMAVGEEVEEGEFEGLVCAEELVGDAVGDAEFADARLVSGDAG